MEEEEMGSSSAVDKIKRKMEYEMNNPVEANKTHKIIIKHLFSRTNETTKKCYFLFKENASHKFKRSLWSKKTLAIVLVLMFTICNSIITAHYLSSFSFEQTNDLFSYIGFIFLSISGITIINARWIKIVAEKYANRF